MVRGAVRLRRAFPYPPSPYGLTAVGGTPIPNWGSAPDPAPQTPAGLNVRLGRTFSPSGV